MMTFNFSSPDQTNHQKRSKSLQGLGFLSTGTHPVMSENENSLNQGDDSVFERRGTNDLIVSKI